MNNLKSDTEIFFKNFKDLKEYLLNKLVSSKKIEVNNYFNFNLHVAFKF